MTYTPQSPSIIGLIAGNGAFPLYVAEAARRQGQRVVAVALKEEADPALQSKVDDITWLSLGQLGKTIDFLKKNGATKAVMAGQVKHTQLFKNIVPDFRAAKLLGRVVNKKAESLLSAVAQEFQAEGIEFLSSVLFLQDWLCPAGVFTQRKPTTDQEEDIAFGLPLAREVARLDIGQTLVVKDKTVVAVEGMEGTDACIRRAGEVAGKGCVVIKVARPKQDLRFDVPVVGSRTVKAMMDAGALVLAMEEGKTLLLEKPALLEEADAAQLAFQGVSI